MPICKKAKVACIGLAFESNIQEFKWLEVESNLDFCGVVVS